MKALHETNDWFEQYLITFEMDKIKNCSYVVNYKETISGNIYNIFVNDTCYDNAREIVDNLLGDDAYQKKKDKQNKIEEIKSQRNALKVQYVLINIMFPFIGPLFSPFYIKNKIKDKNKRIILGVISIALLGIEAVVFIYTKNWVFFFCIYGISIMFIIMFNLFQFIITKKFRYLVFCSIFIIVFSIILQVQFN